MTRVCGGGIKGMLKGSLEPKWSEMGTLLSEKSQRSERLVQKGGVEGSLPHLS